MLVNDGNQKRRPDSTFKLFHIIESFNEMDVSGSLVQVGG